jgi:hypothetical protein
MLEHGFPGMPQPITSKVIKLTTTLTPIPATPNSTPSPAKKFIVIDFDGSQTWFSTYDAALEWFMVSSTAIRVYLLCNEKRTLIAGLANTPKPWTPPPATPYYPKPLAFIVCYMANGVKVGKVEFNNVGWRFVPSLGMLGHKPGTKFRRTWKEAIPSWASPIITKWVLCE